MGVGKVGSLSRMLDQIDRVRAVFCGWKGFRHLSYVRERRSYDKGLRFVFGNQRGDCETGGLVHRIEQRA